MHEKERAAGGASHRKVLVKALILVAFIILAVVIVRSTTVKEYLSPEALGRVIGRAGIWAPLLFILFYAAGVCLFVPGTLLTGLGAAIFGPYQGFLFVCPGAG